MPRPDTQAELLRELQGVPGLSHFESIDAAKFPQPDPQESATALDVAPLKDDRPLFKKMDDKHSTFVGGKGYRMTVRGEFTTPAPDGKGKVRRPYELSFNVPALEGALQLIVSKLLLPALRRYYPNVVNYRTHELIKAEPLTPDTPPPNSLQYMDRERLERYIFENKVPIDPSQYAKVEHLREAVVDHKLNPAGFAPREARRQAERAELAELMRLNPDLDPDRPTPQTQKEVPVNKEPLKDPFLA